MHMPDLNPTMSSGPVELTPEDIDRAQRGESDNPIFAVLLHHQDLMRDHSPDTVEARDDLVNDLADSSPFELDIQTIIATWAIGLEEPAHTGMARAFSVPLFSMYALYNPSGDECASVAAREFIQNGRLPDAMLGKDHLVYARGRMKHIATEITRLSIYVNGVPDAHAEAIRLALSEDPEDAQRLQELINYGKEHSTPLLGAVSENVINATLHLNMSLW